MVRVTPQTKNDGFVQIRARPIAKCVVLMLTGTTVRDVNNSKKGSDK